MTINAFIIKTPQSWDLISKSLIFCSKNKAVDVEYVTNLEDITADNEVISVYVMGLTGLANYVIGVYGKKLINLPEDTIGMHLASMLGQDVIISDESENPFIFTLLRPDGKMISISVDIEKLDKESILEYKKIG